MLQTCRRFYLEVAAVSRFKVAREWELDGYRMAVPQLLQDEPPLAPGTPESEAVAELVKATETAADAWAVRLG